MRPTPSDRGINSVPRRVRGSYRLPGRNEPELTDWPACLGVPGSSTSLTRPGSGYGVKTLPGIPKAVELRSSEEAGQEAARVTAALMRDVAVIEQATVALQAALR